jgi:tRNA dimethylallyltransferase
MLPIIFIVGATAAGKTDVAYQLACRLKAEIISCDSMLIYKEPSIITSKPPEYMLREIPHHFVNIVSVEQSYSVYDYFTSAAKVIQDIFARIRPIVVCGGSGLYVKAMLDGIFEGVGKDEDLRKQLEERAKEYGKDYLHKELTKVDPETAAKVSDLRRIIRALEVYYLTGLPLSKKKQEAKGLWGNLPIKIFGLNLKREALYERINNRVDEMFEKGAVKEVENLLKLNLSLTAQKIIGIKEISGYLKGEYNIEKAKEEMKRNTRRFAKRQLTWFRPDKRIEWLEAGCVNYEQAAGFILKRVGNTA